MLKRSATGKAVPGQAAQRLLQSAVAAARAPSLYAVMGAPDTIEGRFELLTLHTILLIERLRTEGDATEGLRQALFDAFIGHLDGAMREMGVGDLAMGKRMRKLGEAFYGRAASFRSALAALPDDELLQSVISRTVLEGAAASPAPLADYVARSHAALGQGSLGEMVAGAPNWATA